MIISKSHLRIVATILAKDEADIIGRNIEHHVEQGVAHFIITNNRSTDATGEIASRYKEVVEVIDEPGDDHRQAEWVTRMARMACKLDPDWIVHLDADELWCGLGQLGRLDAKAFGSTKMFLHPPRRSGDMSHYLDFEAVPGLPGECKVGHRPDPDIRITHGNHGVVGADPVFTKAVWRHHYPVRSLNQFRKKTVEGHEALVRRRSVCERWERWYNLHLRGSLDIFYHQICDHWEAMIGSPNAADLLPLLEMWSTPEVIRMFEKSGFLPTIGQWPRSDDA